MAEVTYIERRSNVPALVCPGCGQEMAGTESENACEDGEWGIISWECRTTDCPYGPRRMEPGQILNDHQPEQEEGNVPGRSPDGNEG